MSKWRLIPVIVFLALLSACASSVPVGPPVLADPLASAESASIPKLPVDPQVRFGVLPTGLTYYIRENDEPRDRAFLRFAVNAGSILEEDDQRGLAHFVEHMAFNGTENYSGNRIIAYLEQIGMRFGPEVNAYTSFDETVYQLTVPTDEQETFAEAFQVLREWADRLTFAEEEIEKERGVVIEEWRSGRGASRRMQEVQYPVLFGDSLYAERLPIGDVDLIAAFSPEAARSFYDDWYRPDLSAIVAVGDFDADQVEAMINRVFADFTSDESLRERVFVEVPDHVDTKYVVASDPEARYTEVSLIVKRDADPLIGEADYRELIKGSLFSAMLNSRLSEISRRVDAPFLGAGVGTGRLVRTKAAASLSAAVDGNDVGPALEALIVETRRVVIHGFTEGELDRAKRARLRSMEQAFREQENTNSARYADEYVRAFLEAEASPGIAYELGLYEKLLPGITLDELNQVASNYLAQENRVVTVSAVEAADLAPVSESDLIRTVEAASRVAVDPYIDTTVESPLLAKPPVPGRVVDEQVLSGADSTDGEVVQWTLSNGARVVIMSTEHRADQVVFSAYSPGGTSLVADGEYWSARYAPTFVSQMGFGSFSATDLEKELAGAAVSVSPYIDEFREGISGSASVQDLELMFRLIHLKMTEPRRDEDSFVALKHQFEGLIANQENQPQFQLSKRSAELYTNSHPRSMPVDEAGVASISLDSVLRIYEDRFADASDFTFIFVGNIDVASFKPLVETYVASLPWKMRNEIWRDTGVVHPDGIVSDTLEYGIDPVSQVIVRYHGAHQFNQADNYSVRALERLLDIRMQEVIREDESGTYGVGVQATFSRIPQQQYSILITFRADPARIEALTGRLFDVVEEVTSAPVDPVYLDRIRETQRSNFESNLTNNQFWLGQIEYALYHGRPISSIRDYLDLVDGLTAEMLHDTARRYLNGDRYVLVTLKPAPEE